MYQYKHTRDTSGQFTTVEEDDRTRGSKRLEIDTFYVILDDLSSALRAREAVYIDISQTFLLSNASYRQLKRRRTNQASLQASRDLHGRL